VNVANEHYPKTNSKTRKRGYGIPMSCRDCPASLLCMTGRKPKLRRCTQCEKTFVRINGTEAGHTQCDKIKLSYPVDLMICDWCWARSVMGYDEDGNEL
jgi:hypothetical protein